MRSSDLAQLDLCFRRYLPEGVCFQSSGLAKQDRPGKVRTEFFFPKFDQKSIVCPVTTLKAATSGVRTSDGEQKLLLAVVKPHKPIAPSSVARWLKMALQKSGVNISIFKGHSTRAASATAAVSAGITVAEILQAADWSSEGIFQKFYYKPSRDVSFGTAVLSTE